MGGKESKRDVENVAERERGRGVGGREGGGELQFWEGVAVVTMD